MNYELFRVINGWSGADLADDWMTFVAQDLIYAVVAVLAVLCLRRLRSKDFRPVLLCTGGLAVTFALGLLAAAAHPERRPFQSHRVHQVIDHSPGQSFPSDHAMAAFGIALVVLVFLSRPWGVALFVVAALIGFARVYSGVHYPGDVAGSLLVAVLGVGAVAAAAQIIPRGAGGWAALSTAGLP